MGFEHWSIPGANNQPIYGTTHLPASDVNVRGVLLLCHGFRGFKDYGFLPQLAEAASHAGMIAHRFNFSHSGVTQDFSTFARTDLFEQDTWGKQIHDLQTIAAASTEILPGKSAGKIPMIWFGHSRGGVTVLLTASRRFQNSDSDGVFWPPPAGVITAAAPCQCCSLNSEQIQIMQEQGYIETPSFRTGQNLRLGYTWLKEQEQNPKAFNPLIGIKNIDCPILLIHGDADKTVPFEEAHRYQVASKGRAQLEMISDANHTFNAPNPLPLDQTPPPTTQKMIDLVIDFTVAHC